MCVTAYVGVSAFYVSKKHLTNILQSGNKLMLVLEVPVSPNHVSGSTVKTEGINTCAAQI